MSRQRSRYQRTNPNKTLTMNDGRVYRERLSDGEMIQVWRNPAVRGTTQGFEVAIKVPPPPVVQAVEVLEVDV